MPSPAPYSISISPKTPKLQHMETLLSRQSLISSEKLMYPSCQVIAVTANLGCAACRQKVFQLVSRMSGLREYTVDLRNKRVIVKGDVKVRWDAAATTTHNGVKEKKWPSPFKCLIPACFH